MPKQTTIMLVGGPYHGDLYEMEGAPPYFDLEGDIYEPHWGDKETFTIVYMWQGPPQGPDPTAAT